MSNNYRPYTTATTPRPAKLSIFDTRRLPPLTLTRSLSVTLSLSKGLCRTFRPAVVSPVGRDRQARRSPPLPLLAAFTPNLYHVSRGLSGFHVVAAGADRGPFPV